MQVAATRPPVSVVILNHERVETLRKVVKSVLDQEYPDLDVIVVDNASTDGSVNMIEKVFPGVRIVALPANVGCAARNCGVTRAKGEIVVTLDNDVLLTSPRDIETITEIFAERFSVACINFQILDSDGRLSTRDWCHPRASRQFADEEFLTSYVLEGASAFRRQAFENIGGYWPPFFIGHEGHDLAYRMLEAGYDLLYSPRVRVTHLLSEVAREPARLYYTYTRNSLWVALRNHRASAAAGAIARNMALMAFASARAGYFGSYLRGLWAGVRGSPRAWSSRSPLSPAAYEKLRQIHCLEPGLLEKVKRHIRERPM